MAVLMTKDKKEIIVTCNCGCKSSVNIQIDEMEDILIYEQMIRIS